MAAPFVAASTEIFNALHGCVGRPVLSIYPPISTWTLDAGVSYDTLSDTFVDATGAPYGQAHAGQTKVKSDYIVADALGPVDVDVSGVVETPELTTVYLPYTVAVNNALTTAWAIEVADVLYRVVERSYWPPGVKTPGLIELRLRERNSAV